MVHGLRRHRRTGHAAGPPARPPGAQRDRGPDQPDERAARALVLAEALGPAARAVRGGDLRDADLALYLSGGRSVAVPAVYPRRAGGGSVTACPPCAS